MGEQRQRDVAIPAYPSTALVVIQADLAFGIFQTVLDRPLQSTGRAVGQVA